MRSFEGIHFAKTRVTIDDTDFRKCTITNCELIYSGGTFGWTDTTMKNCRLVFCGSAALTVSFLEKFALVDVSQERWKAVTLEFPPAGETIQ
jgi:hypothetical protein